MHRAHKGVIREHHDKPPELLLQMMLVFLFPAVVVGDIYQLLDLVQSLAFASFLVPLK